MKYFRIVMIGFAKLQISMGNHIITLAVQAHNGEPCEPHNSKLKINRKRENFSAKTDLFSLLSL